MKETIQIINQQTSSLGFLKIHNYRLKHRLLNGHWSNEMSRLVVDRGNSVAVLAVDLEREKVILTRQFRIGALNSKNPWLTELIAGVVDDNESPEDAAVREAKEESGADIRLHCQIAEFYGSPGACSEKTRLYFATVDSQNCLAHAGHPSENEDIEILLLSFTEFFQKLDQGHFETASLLIAGLWLKIHLNQVLELTTQPTDSQDFR
jgi:ADP-ribose pyrophosphatase